MWHPSNSTLSTLGAGVHILSNMDGARVELTVAFLQSCDPDRICHFIFGGVEPDAAEWLVARIPEDIHLWVTHLSPESAGILARHRQALHFRRLTHIDAGVAEVLSAHESGLCFWDLQELSLSCAEFLGRTKACLIFGGITELAPEVAACFVTHGRGLNFFSLRTLEPEAASWLAKRTVRMHLTVEELPVASAEAIARFQGRMLSFTFGRLAPAAAERLAAYPGALTLYLSSLKSISHKTAAALVSHTGPLYFGSSAWGEKVCTELARHQGLVGAKHPPRFTKAGALALARTSQTLRFYQIKSMPDWLCEAFSTHTGTLEIPRVTRMSKKGARALLKHPGPLMVTCEKLPKAVGLILSQRPILADPLAKPPPS